MLINYTTSLKFLPKGVTKFVNWNLYQQVLLNPLFRISAKLDQLDIGMSDNITHGLIGIFHKGVTKSVIRISAKIRHWNV